MLFVSVLMTILKSVQGQRRGPRPGAIVHFGLQFFALPVFPNEDLMYKGVVL